MPLYEYADPVTGQVFEEHRAIGDRDKPLVREIAGRRVRCRRVTVPRRLSVHGLRPPTTQAQRVLAGYYREECRQGSRFKSDFTPREIRETYAHDTED